MGRWWRRSGPLIRTEICSSGALGGARSPVATRRTIRAALDNGCIGESICAYGDAATAVAEFLRPYSEVTRCSTESYWLARRSREADLAVWVWIERHESDEAIEAFGIRMPSGRTADQGLTHLPK
jgi:hypothetical protein